MYVVSIFLQHYGYLLLLLIGFAEFVGVPIASVPVLLVVGAVAAEGMIHPVLAVLSIIAGGLAGETLWYAIARWQGARVVDFGCALASNPTTCVLGFRDKLRKRGAAYLVAAKFIPGAGSIPAVAAGMAGIPMKQFIAIDAGAIALWASVYMACGWLGSDQLEPVLNWVVESARVLVPAVLGLFAVSGLWRVVKVRMHRPMHAATSGGASAAAGERPATGV